MNWDRLPSAEHKKLKLSHFGNVLSRIAWPCMLTRSLRSWLDFNQGSGAVNVPAYAIGGLSPSEECGRAAAASATQVPVS